MKEHIKFTKQRMEARLQEVISKMEEYKADEVSAKEKRDYIELSFCHGYLLALRNEKLHLEIFLHSLQRALDFEEAMNGNESN